MDGLLLDSERLARDCFMQACEDIGWQPDLTAYDRCVGGTYEATEQILVAAYGPDFPYARLSEHWGKHYEAYIQNQPVAIKAGALELLNHLAHLGIPRALATSTRRPTASQKLRLAGLDGYFSHLVCGGETPLGKPHPDPYLEATRQLSHPPEFCWALEDSNNGVRAAHAAGLRVFQVPDLIAPDAEVVALGHQVVSSLFDVLDLLRVA